MTDNFDTIINADIDIKLNSHESKYPYEFKLSMPLIMPTAEASYVNVKQPSFIDGTSIGTTKIIIVHDQLPEFNNISERLRVALKAFRKAFEAPLD